MSKKKLSEINTLADAVFLQSTRRRAILAHVLEVDEIKRFLNKTILACFALVMKYMGNIISYREHRGATSERRTCIFMK